MIDRKPIVSVIIPTFNRPQFIQRAIDSCFAQRDVDVDIIVVDDNGVGTEAQQKVASLIKYYLERDNFRYIPHEHNKNGSAARNTGIRAAKGEYVAFLDDDDWFEDNKLSKQIELMKKEKTRACLTGFRRVYSNTTVDGCPVLYDAPFQFLSVTVDACGGSGLLLETQLAHELGGFQESFIRHQDVEFNYRLSRVTKISVVNEILVNVQMHPGNFKLKSNQRIINAKLHYLDAFKEEIEHYPKEIQNFIYDAQFIEIVKAYLKDKKYHKAIYWIFKTSRPFKTVLRVLSATKSFINRNKRIKVYENSVR